MLDKLLHLMDDSNPVKYMKEILESIENLLLDLETTYLKHSADRSAAIDCLIELLEKIKDKDHGSSDTQN